MSTTDLIALFIVFLVLVSFIKLHLDKDSNFNLFDLVMENGRLSKIACVFLASFLVCSWVMVKTEEMTEGLLMAYGGIFVAPIIAKMFRLKEKE